MLTAVRIATQAHASVKPAIQSMSQQYAIWDDGDMSWEPYEDLDELDVVLEARLRDDDLQNGEKIRKYA